MSSWQPRAGSHHKHCQLTFPTKAEVSKYFRLVMILFAIVVTPLLCHWGLYRVVEQRQSEIVFSVCLTNLYCDYWSGNFTYFLCIGKVILNKIFNSQLKMQKTCSLAESAKTGSWLELFSRLGLVDPCLRSLGYWDSGWLLSFGHRWGLSTETLWCGSS